MLQTFNGHTVLVVEDEPLIALDIQATLSSAGAEVIVAPSLREGFAVAQQADISAAFLDVALGDGDCAPLCRTLTVRKVPFIFHTGYATGGVLDQWPNAPILMKPSTQEQLLDCLAAAISSHARQRRYR
jgi:DNA-binding response OmpR family regulator